MEEKIIKQISLFAENKPGRLANVADKLKTTGINIRAFTIAESGDFGIIRMVVDRSEDAHRVLHDAGFTVSETEVLGIEMEDIPGSMSMIADVLGKADINLDYAYAFITRGQKALLIVRVNDIKKAIQLLQEQNIRLIGMKELENL
ncbi:MAG: acetolactate synthase [Methanosarcinaceae archaeon]|nr:acetolactate synthase [Methanosarcinaceae archaeon]